jgi:hypothetical protein
MKFGSDYRFLHLIGIADRPGPVILNIYIDGYYKGQVSWSNNDNARHLTIGQYPGIPYGVHFMAVEFANDATTGSGADGDRNFYLDVLGVTNY